MAKIETRILETETPPQPKTRSHQPKAANEARLVLPGHMGMRVKAAGSPKATGDVFGKPKSIELFVGAGGLALGISSAGFHHEAIFEWDLDACETIRKNQRLGVRPVTDWDLRHADVRDVDFSDVASDVTLVAGGPPCQPFSLGGKHRGYEDSRDMFPQAVRAVRELRPRAVIFENVKGLLRASFSDYFEYIKLQLSFPENVKGRNEAWPKHLERLRKASKGSVSAGLRYKVHHRLLNAADFGVPQRRERVFIVAFRADLNLDWAESKFAPTHSFESLLWDQWVSGDYWTRHAVSKIRRPQMPARFKSLLGNLKRRAMKPRLQAWRTVRDVIADLPSPMAKSDGGTNLDHYLIPGAKVYPGHTGSPLDQPAKTLKAGAHGVPGGENMLAMPNGSVRYFTIRESARIQTFPDQYRFTRSWTETMRQLGNAVPVLLGQVVASDVKRMLELRSNTSKPNSES